MARDDDQLMAVYNECIRATLAATGCDRCGCSYERLKHQAAERGDVLRACNKERVCAIMREFCKRHDREDFDFLRAICAGAFFCFGYAENAIRVLLGHQQDYDPVPALKHMQEHYRAVGVKPFPVGQLDGMIRASEFEWLYERVGEWGVDEAPEWVEQSAYEEMERVHQMRAYAAHAFDAVAQWAAGYATQSIELTVEKLSRGQDLGVEDLSRLSGIASATLGEFLLLMHHQITELKSSVDHSYKQFVPPPPLAQEARRASAKKKEQPNGDGE